MREYDVVFKWTQDGEEEVRIQIGLPSQTAARNCALAARENYPDVPPITVEVIDADLICEVCMGTGKMADGTKPITREKVYWIPCDCCNGTGNESGKPTKTYFTAVI